MAKLKIEFIKVDDLADRFGAAAEKIIEDARECYAAELSSAADNPAVIAVARGRFAGALWLSRYFHPAFGRHVAEIDIVVEPAFRQRGIASHLVQIIRHVAEDSGGFVVCRPYTEDGTALVRALGMKESKEHPEYWRFLTSDLNAQT